MASNLRRTDDLQRLKTRELVMQRTDGTYAAENSVPRFGTATGDITTSNVTIDPYDNVVVPGGTTTAQITAVNGNINLSTAEYQVQRSGNDLLWVSPAGTTVLNAPTVVDSNIVAESLTVSNGTINLPTAEYQVQRSGNDLLWVSPAGTTVLNAPTVVDSNIVAESLTVSNGTINLPTAEYRLDNSGNDLLWISPAGTTVLNAQGADLARGNTTLTLLDTSASTIDIVTAFNSLLALIASKNILFTLATPTPLLTITAQTYTTLTVSWSPSIPTTDKLILYLNDESNGVLYNATGSYTFTNLVPGVSYTVRGTYRTNNGTSPTLTGATVSMPYTGFTAVADSTTSIAVAWTATPSIEITGVEIWYAVVGAGYTLFSTVSTPTTTASITGLTQGTSYSVYVQYTTGVHTGPYTPTTVQTLSPPPAAPLQFGPLSIGKTYVTDNTIYGRESGNGFPSIFGYRVPVGSSWIGYKFNQVLFPVGVITSLNPYGDGLLQISAYTDSSLSNLVASSPAVPITNRNNISPMENRWIDAYTFTMDTTVTLTAGMHIVFKAFCVINPSTGYPTQCGEVRFRVFTSSPSDPIIGIKNGPSSQPPQPISDAGTNSSALCDFKLV